MTPENPLDEGETEAGSGNAGLQKELLRSYLKFGRRAIRQRWLWVACVMAIGFSLTGVVMKLAPRSYTCTTVMMAAFNPVLESYNGQNPLSNAPTLITRQENREALVRETDLLHKYEARRPVILRMKDQLTQSLFGKWSDETKMSILVGTLGSRLSVANDPAGNLNISVDWSDGQTAAELAEAARQGFLRTRHADEISAFEAKMSILDEHASKMRDEVETLAQQINAAHAAQITKENALPSTAPALAAVQRGIVRRTTPDLGSVLSADLPERKEKLAEKKQQLTTLENDRERRIREEQAKLAEMLLHLTPSHPQVVTQQERIALASRVPSELALLRSEVTDLEGTLKARQAMAAHGSSTVPGGPAVSGTGVLGGAALPTEIIQALESEKTDPALTAQISGAVARYGQLRDEMRAGRMQLDTAQAAFDHRYQIVVPAEVPKTPTKPKPGIILAAGLILSVLLALVLPILAELRRGLIIERWQVQLMQLPVLAELKLPPHSSD